MKIVLLTDDSIRLEPDAGAMTIEALSADQAYSSIAIGSFAPGGTSAEACMKTLKLASAKYLDALPTTGNEHGRAFRDLAIDLQKRFTDLIRQGMTLEQVVAAKPTADLDAKYGSSERLIPAFYNAVRNSLMPHSAIGVSTKLGQTAFTVMLVRANSAARLRVSPSSAVLLVV